MLLKDEVSSDLENLENLEMSRIRKWSQTVRENSWNSEKAVHVREFLKNRYPSVSFQKLKADLKNSDCTKNPQINFHIFRICSLIFH